MSLNWKQHRIRRRRQAHLRVKQTRIPTKHLIFIKEATVQRIERVVYHVARRLEEPIEPKLAHVLAHRTVQTTLRQQKCP